MSKRQRSGTQSISLFPFLAVLVCAMGALILLLVVTTRRIRADAVARNQPMPVIVEESAPVEVVSPVVEEEAPPKKTAPTPTPAVWMPDPELAELDASLRRLGQEKTEIVRQLVSQENTIARLQEDAKRRERALTATRGELDGSKEELAKQLQLLLSLQQESKKADDELTRLGRRLQTRTQKNSNARSKFAFVPFDGLSGTTRRPIFIECTEQAIIFHPEGITLSAEDLEGFTPGHNPLLAGAVALTDFWKNWNRRQPVPAEEPQPYVLLLVRPSGSVAFYVARRLLEELGDEYGYELLEANLELEFPDPDPRARIVCQQAIDEVLTQRSEFVQGIQGQGKSRGDLLGTSSKTMRGGGEQDGSRGLAGRIAAGAGGGGQGQHPEGIGTGHLPTLRNNFSQAQASGADANRPAGGFQTQGERRVAELPKTGPHSGNLYRGSGFPEGVDSAGLPKPLTGDKSGVSQKANQPGRGTGQYGDGGHLSGRQSDPGASNDPATTARTGGPSNNASGESNVDAEFQSGTGGSPQGNSEIGADESYEKEGKTHGKGFGRETDVAARGGEPSRLFDGDTGGESGQRSRQSANDAPISTNGSGQSNQYEPDVDSSGLPTPSFTKTFGNNDDNKSSRPSFGGQTSSFGRRRGTIGFEREITVSVFAEQIIVGEKYTLPVGEGETRDELMQKFTHTVDRHIYSWGNPPANFYWVPSLKFLVAPAEITITGEFNLNSNSGGLRPRSNIRSILLLKPHLRSNQMSRRKVQEELEFGSDSFLDIVANIVGILIILIVIAGVRVSQAPLAAALVESEEVKSPEPDVSQLEIPIEFPAPALLTEQEDEVVETGPSFSELRVEELKRIEQLRKRKALLNREVAMTTEQLSAVESNAIRWQEHGQALETELEAVRQALVAKANGTEARNEQIETALASLQEKKKALEEFAVKVDLAEKSKPPVKKLKHRLTPLSQTVEGNEIHFRLSENRVSAVPLQELLGRLRGQVERQKQWLMKFPRHQGTVGPVDGYNMSYVVVRQRSSVIEEMRQGRTMMRIGVAKWVIEPEEDVPGETAVDALQRGSQFYRRLLAADANSTLTFWVYPDSFGLYRQLQEFAHREGFTVAARPLPEGVPIAGSPNGTKSAGQ